MSKHKHLTLDERYQIQRSLGEGLSFRAIASLIGKDCTTISKEIRAHILFEAKGAPYRPFNDCLNRRRCSHFGDLCSPCSRKRKTKCSFCGKGCRNCPDYRKEDCLLLRNPPYVCNGCPNRNECTLEKHLYDAKSAQQEYEQVRSESRSGFNLTEQERVQMDQVISPLLRNGHSLHHILLHHPGRILCCEKTLYTYADHGLFEARNIDMPRKVRFRPRKKKSVPFKVDKTCRIGRTYDDFRTFREAHPALPVVQLDTVEGIKGGAVLLTIHFVLQKFQLAFFRTRNDAASVTQIFQELSDRLGPQRYRQLFPLLLADNGSEFSDRRALEFAQNGTRRSRLFYCNPASPNEKGSCEVNHEFIRRIIPKGRDIGLFSEEGIRVMMDHINSYSRPELGDKSPYEMFAFYFGRQTLDRLQVQKIPPNEIVLTPKLLEPYRLPR